MCGFICISQLSLAQDSHPLPAPLEQMNRRLVHRGPDDEGYFFTSTNQPGQKFRLRSMTDLANRNEIRSCNLGLAHRRLSILDLSPAAAQPMSTSDGHLSIVYNGEIFNYLELKQELQAMGEDFSTHSDTEVILKAYERWGEKCLGRFNGMWAFVIWDERRRILFCARDRFGIKPFYYFWNGELFAAASEVKALLAHSAIQPKVDEEAIYDYLLFGFQDHSDSTFFRSIRQIPSSHYLILDTSTKKMRIEKWWDLELKEPPNGKGPSVSEARGDFLELLTDSIRLRLRSDVPIGMCVSGGLDSSAVAYLMEKVERKEGANLMHARKSFSCCFEDPACDDRPFIRAVTEGLAMKPFITFPRGEDLWHELEEMTWMMDEPFRSSNQFSQWALMKLISQNGIRVALSGQGSDEILGGYRGYASVFIADLIRRGKWWRACREWVKTPSNEEGIGKILLTTRILYGLSPTYLAHAVPRLEGITGKTIRVKALPFINDRFQKRHSERYVARLKEQHPNWGNLRRKIYQDLFRYSLPQLLHYEDRMGMAFSVEARHPFLDHRLIEYVYSLPESHIFHAGQRKWILRQAISDIVPEMICNRKDKKGFITPESRWLRLGEPHIRKIFSRDSGIAAAAYLNPQKILESLSSDFKKDTYSQHTQMWRPLNLEVWFRKFGCHD